MFKKIWQKIKQNHLLLMIICCLIPVVLVTILVPLFKESTDYLIWLIVLLCPLSHLLIMRGCAPGDTCEKEKKKKSGLHKGRKY